MRRATGARHVSVGRGLISIHALREESDPVDGDARTAVLISIHALREESDRF